MLKNFLLKFCIIINLLISNLVVAQSKKQLQNDAYDAMYEGEFQLASEKFEKLCKLYPEDIEYKYELGICYLKYTAKKEKAIEIFTDLRNNQDIIEADFYLGKAYLLNYKFDEAIQHFNKYIEETIDVRNKEDKKRIKECDILIKNCENGKKIMASKNNAIVRNLGKTINSNEDQYVPVITPDESIIFYTYVGNLSTGGKLNAHLNPDPVFGSYREDAFASLKLNDTSYSEPISLKNINTKGNDAVIGISGDGQKLFTYYSDDKNAGDIKQSVLKGNEFSSPVFLNKNINSEYWEGSCSISSDNKYLYFSSERVGGYGGKDIWCSEYIDGNWGPAKNLGPKINTSYDEDAPFIHPDGMTLFFSSKGHSSIGGFDVMYSKITDLAWSEPKNMGLPLNSPEDDCYFVLNAKGNVGYFSSNRGDLENYGRNDIYMLTPGMSTEIPVVALIKGKITLDEKSVEAKIDVIKYEEYDIENQKNTLYFNYNSCYSNSQSGNFMTTLNPGFKYRLIISLNNYKPFEKEIDLRNLTEFNETILNFDFTSPERLAEIAKKRMEDSLLASSKNNLVNEINSQISSCGYIFDADKKPIANKKLNVYDYKTNGFLFYIMTTNKGKFNFKNLENEKNYLFDLEENDPNFNTSTKVQISDCNLSNFQILEKNTAGKFEFKMKDSSLSNSTISIAQTNGIINNTETIKPQPCNNSIILDLSNLKGKSLNIKENYSKLFEIAGNYCSTGLTFVVQIGAYKKPNNFKHQKFDALGKVEEKLYPDSITRFTINNNINNLNDSEKIRKKAVEKGCKDAWIVALYEGKRYTLEELILLDFFSKPIN